MAYSTGMMRHRITIQNRKAAVQGRFGLDSAGVEWEDAVTRAKAINAAEMLAYDLHNALEVASFNASLARKARNQEDAEEVREHDEFIAAVKSELTAIGVEK